MVSFDSLPVSRLQLEADVLLLGSDESFVAAGQDLGVLLTLDGGLASKMKRKFHSFKNISFRHQVHPRGQR